MATLLKICSKCSVEKPLDQYRYKKGGKYLKHSYCKECEALSQKLRRERLKQENYEGYTLDVQRRMLKQNYNISLETYMEMLESQSYACAICKNTCSKNLAVDHCHTSGKIRGLLCQKCNRGLGFFNDEPNLLKTAINYLEKYKNGN